MALATALAVVPLLPRGLVYLGWPDRGYVELLIPALAVLWSIARLGARQRQPPAIFVTLPWDLLAATIVGAAVYGLMADNPIRSPVFHARLLAEMDELFRPMHMTAHPLYSLRVGLTFIEGWLAFRLILGICRLSPDPRQRAEVGLVGWVAGLSITAVLALVQYVTEFSLHPYWVRANPSLVRTNSTLDDPNTLGAVLALGICLLVGLLRLDRRRRGLRLALLGLMAVGLFTTMSRSGIGAAMLAPLAVLALSPAPLTGLQRLIRTGARVTVGLVILAVAGSMALRGLTVEQRRTNPSGPVDMLVKTFDPRESTGWVLRGRLPWWQAGAAMFRTDPVVGVGLGRYPRLMAAYGGGPHRENAHNLFLQLLAEAGAIGFTAFTLLIVSLWVRLVGDVTDHKLDDRGRAVALGGLMAILAFVLTLLTGHALLLPSGQILFAGFVALTLTAARAHPSRSPLQSAPGRRALALVGVLGVALIAPVMGLTRDVTPRPTPWGYVSGLHDEERPDQGEPYRWTTDHAVLDLSVPGDATSLVVRLTAVYPVRDGVPTVVRLSTSEAAADVRLTSSDVHTVRLPLRAGTRRILLEVNVTPTFVPPAGSGDTRVLGAQLFVPQFTTSSDAGDASR